MDKKTVVGLIEEITIFGKNKQIKVIARIDTGAKSNSIDLGLAKELGINPNGKTTIVKSSMGKVKREVVDLDIEIAGKKFKKNINSFF